MQSFWEEERMNYKEYDSLKQDMKVSVCIIGGGLTGLSAAYYLSSKLNVAVVEKNRICSSTSGKNTGKLTSQQGLFYKYLLESEGKEFASKYLDANEQAINNIEEITKKENIECDFARESAFVFTTKESEIPKIKDEQRAVSKIVNKNIKENIFSKFTKNVSLPLNVLGAIEFENEAKIHPIKYGYGLAKCIENNNGQIFENSHVTNVKSEDDKYIVEVNNKRIVCDYVVIATRYPIVSFPGFHFLKMYQSTSYAIVVDPKVELFDGMYINVEVPTLSFRTITANNKNLLLAVGYDYKTGTENITDGYKNLENVVKNMYPNSEVLYKWTAEDCITLDKFAYIGRFSKMMPNMYVATGYNKWGLTTSNIAANIIKSEILGEPNKYKELFESTRMEPIKNRQEVGNMLKEAGKSILLSKFKLPKAKLNEVKVGEGKVIDVNHTKVGVYKSEDGKVYVVKPICTHLGCELYFNNVEKLWECPCHGSKFTYDGKSIEVPSNKNLEVNIENQ